MRHPILPEKSEAHYETVIIEVTLSDAAFLGLLSKVDVSINLI